MKKEYGFEKGTYIPYSIYPKHRTNLLIDLVISDGWDVIASSERYVYAEKNGEQIKVYANGWVSA